MSDQIICGFQKLQCRTLVKVFTMIQELLESLLWHSGEFHQLFELFCCRHRRNQESVADSYEVDMLDEHAFPYLPRVWQWPVGFGRDRDLQYLLLDLPD